jgi:hypothetical protein
LTFQDKTADNRERGQIWRNQTQKSPFQAVFRVQNRKNIAQNPLYLRPVIVPKMSEKLPKTCINARKCRKEAILTHRTAIMLNRTDF